MMPLNHWQEHRLIDPFHSLTQLIAVTESTLSGARYSTLTQAMLSDSLLHLVVVLHSLTTQVIVDTAVLVQPAAAASEWALVHYYFTVCVIFWFVKAKLEIQYCFFSLHCIEFHQFTI